MPLKNNIVYESLLSHNYFPEQKRDKEELPPIFSTRTFTTTVANQLCNEPLRGGRSVSQSGYDQVEYRITRYNNVSRPISIPHPMPYANLAGCISNNWNKLDYICSNANSLVFPKKHSDGRIIIMDYSKENIESDLSNSFGNKFRVRTDIANFFPSIYTHSIPWALVGFSTAKSNKHGSVWYNRLDTYQRYTKRNETQGIPIGPATSNIISELILARVDDKLSSDFTYYRYVDDYICYCDTYEKADKFIRRLSVELWKYKLLLNISKTTIEPLPVTLSQNWILDLYTRLPEGKEINVTLAIRFLDYAVSIQNKTPDGSVLKFAAKSIKGKLHKLARKSVLEYLLQLSLHYPILLPLLDSLFDNVTTAKKSFGYDKQLKKILDLNIINCRSDAMCWVIYYMLKFGIKINRARAKKVIETRDCLAITLIYKTGNYDTEVINFINSLDHSDRYELDQHWILLYQVYRDNKIQNPYPGDNTFQILRNGNVTFLR